MNPKLGRLIEFDEKSRKFPLKAVVAPKPPRSYTWACQTWLDQGDSPSCVGHGWAHELAARPDVIAVDEKLALKLYHEAQELDQYPGDNYDGSSVLGGAKAVTKDGYMKEYRWGFSLDDLILGVGYTGPSVIGINWYSDMFEPDSKGLIKIGGSIEGGHCLLVNGVNIKKQLFRLHNSWGKSWGIDGECFISFDDMRRLLKEDGEQCFPVNRVKLA